MATPHHLSWLRPRAQRPLDRMFASIDDHLADLSDVPLDQPADVAQSATAPAPIASRRRSGHTPGLLHRSA